MIDRGKLIEKAKHSSFYLKVLNWSLGRMIPFNRPHGFRVTNISDYSVTIFLPYIKKNLNHIRGLHACALATLSEFTTGLLLISRLDATRFRLIMQKLEMNYHYQGKADASAEFSLSQEWFNENIFEPLKTRDAVVVTCEVMIRDRNGNHLTTGRVQWQIKNWDKVRTKVAA